MKSSMKISKNQQTRSFVLTPAEHSSKMWDQMKKLHFVPKSLSLGGGGQSQQDGLARRASESSCKGMCHYSIRPRKMWFKKISPFTSLFFLFSSAPATHPLNFIVGSRVCTWQMWSVFLVPSRPHGTWNKDSLCLVDGINKKREFDEFSTCSTHALDWHKIILFFGGIFGVDIYIYMKCDCKSQTENP